MFKRKKVNHPYGMGGLLEMNTMTKMNWIRCELIKILAGDTMSVALNCSVGEDLTVYLNGNINPSVLVKCIIGVCDTRPSLRKGIHVGHRSDRDRDDDLVTPKPEPEIQRS